MLAQEDLISFTKATALQQTLHKQTFCNLKSKCLEKLILGIRIIQVCSIQEYPDNACCDYNYINTQPLQYYLTINSLDLLKLHLFWLSLPLYDTTLTCLIITVKLVFLNQQLKALIQKYSPLYRFPTDWAFMHPVSTHLTCAMATHEDHVLQTIHAHRTTSLNCKTMNYY